MRSSPNELFTLLFLVFLMVLIRIMFGVVANTHSQLLLSSTRGHSLNHRQDTIDVALWVVLDSPDRNSNTI